MATFPTSASRRRRVAPSPGHWAVSSRTTCQRPWPRSRPPSREMQTEILIFDGIDELDALGPYEVLAEAGFDVALVTHPATDRVATARDAIVVPHRRLSDRAELLVVPGGRAMVEARPGPKE